MAEYRSRRQGLDTVRGLRGAEPKKPSSRGRSAVKAKERDAAKERSKTPYVAPEPTVQNEVERRRGGGVQNRGKYELPNFLQPSAISTPVQGVRSAPKPAVEKPAAPAKPAEKAYRSRRQGLDATYPERAPKGDTRTNANGLVSYGKDLSSLNAFTSAFTGGYELTDVKSAFQSNTLPGAEEYGANRHQLQDTPYELADDATPSNVGGNYTMDGVDTSIQSTGYQISDKSVPGTIGGNSNDPQDGTSSKPDVAESIRQVRMQRKGPRDEGSFRGFQIDRNNEMVQNATSETEGNGMNEKRRAIRSTFLNHEGNSIQAVAAANAVAGYGKDSNGSPQFNYGGELVGAKEGMAYKAKNAAMMGEDPSQYLDIPTAGDIQPDTPAASELSTNLLSGVEPGSIAAPENNGGSLETTAPLTTPSPEKFKQAQDFMSGKMNMLNRRTK